MILSKEQARAVYDAMCALTAVGATVDAIKLPNRKTVIVYWGEEGFGVSKDGVTKEHHDGLAMFHLAYDL